MNFSLKHYLLKTFSNSLKTTFASIATLLTKMSLHRGLSIVLIAAITLLVGAVAQENPSTADSTIRKIHAGINAPAKEISPGLYSHDFEHVTDDGTRTSISYLARKVKHLVHLADVEVGLVSVTCQEGVVVEVVVTNASAPPLWTVASAEVNATILVGNDYIKCKDTHGNDDISILHRVTQLPALVKHDAASGAFVYRLLAESTHFSHAFEHLHLKFYKGKKDIAAAKADLKQASHDGKTSKADSHQAAAVSPPPVMPVATESTALGANEHELDFDLSTPLHDGNTIAGTESAGGRHLLSSYSCDHSGYCPVGKFNYDWDYGSSCCCDNWGTCSWRACGTEYKPTCNSCSADKACYACSYCNLCSGYHTCDSCVQGSDRPHLIKKTFGYECEACRDDNDCASGYVCDKGTLGVGRRSCKEGVSLACYGDMPAKHSGATKSGSKYVVTLKTVSLNKHDPMGNVFAETSGGHEYYAMTKQRSTWGPKINIPCLAHEPLITQLTVDTKVAEVSCGDSFRFGIWEDDHDLGSGLLDDPMGDRWFSTLDFLTSPTNPFKSASASAEFELECKGCHESCTEKDSLAHTFTPSPVADVDYSKKLSDVVSKDQYLPVGIWNYDRDGMKAKEEYKLTAGGLTMNCKDCHLTVSDAELYVEFKLDLYAGFKEFAVLADSEVTFHIDALLSGEKDSTQKWTNILVAPKAIPYLSVGAGINFAGATIEFIIGLKAGANLVTEMATAVQGSANYKSDVVGKLKAGLIYDKETGSKFLSSASISNENVDWENSINGELSTKISIQPCLQGGIWGNAADYVSAHAYAQICGDVFGRTTLSHQSSGYETSPAADSDMSKALVKFNDILPSTFSTCEVSSTSKHDTRLLVQVGIGSPILSADFNAAVNWGTSSPGEDDSKDEELRTSAYGPWTLPSLELSIPVASGCLCVSACSGGGVGSDSTLAPAPPPAPSTSDVNMPTQGTFVEGTLSLVGMQLYEWNSAAELAFRKTIAASAEVWVNHVRIDSVTERQISQRRRLLATSALDVEYVVYSASPDDAGTIASRISSDTKSGTIAALARNFGLSEVTSVSVVKDPSMTTVAAAAANLKHVLYGIFFSLLSVFLLS